MANQPSAATVNSFIGGLKTEFTGLNFPDNACTDTQNCVFNLIGDVTRRGGMDFETNSTTNTVNRAGQAINTYKWNNVGGDGQTQIVVVQCGGTLFFYQSTNATLSSPLSTTLLASTISLAGFTAAGGSFSSAVECQFADGNGYLFVYHPNCDPFYCTFTLGTPNTVSAAIIQIQIRDFNGVYPEPGNPSFSSRSSSITNEHLYNIQNQGWTSQTIWSATSSVVQVGPYNFQFSGVSLSIAAGLYTFTNVGSIPGAAPGQQVSLTVGGGLQYNNNGQLFFSGFDNSALPISGVVVSYTGTTMVINITTSGTFFTLTNAQSISQFFDTSWTISESNTASTATTFASAIGLYPSNSDIWYQFKNTSDIFSPATTIGNVSLSNAPAPKGHFILSAFTQNRSAISGVPSISTISTTVRPRTGTWFQGRVWFTGVDASQQATGDQTYYTWTENIYFSQIITNQSEFGYCYQENDPTDENLSDEFSTDGGVIVIQGSGAIYKLFPVQNGLLVFAANGIWFITGSQGIGFSATDYTVTKISGIQSISPISFVNVMGYPVFWNEEGIYAVTPAQGGSLTVTNMCLGTILTFYNNIPLISKKFARGDYNPIDFEIQWCYRSTNESSPTDRYQFDRILVFNVETKAFYYYTLPAGLPYVHDVRYVSGPGGSTSPMPVFKYLTSYANLGSYKFTFSEEKDFTDFRDWFSLDSVGVNYTSFFTTGYKLSPRSHPFYGMYGQFYKKFNINYLYMFLRNTVKNSYKIQGLFNFGITGSSGKWSTVQVINDNTSTTNFGMLYRRHRIRGHGLALQFKVQSVDGKAFDIMGWSGQESFASGV